MISNDYWLDISRDLEPHHALFYQCWQMGKPSFTDAVPTAAVAFNKSGDFIEFLFNPDFWNSLTHYERLFVIGHECLHVVFNHGMRTKDATDADKTNKALDIVVNHMLVTSFGFERDKIKNSENLCWVDTIFAGLPNIRLIPLTAAFEYYYKLMPETQRKTICVLDDHSKMSGDWSNIVGKLNDSLTPQEKDAIKNILERHDTDQQGGKGRGKWTFVNVEQTRKRKWETIIKQWSLKYMRADLELKEQWVRSNRRLFGLGGGLILPSEMEDDMMDKDRLPVFFFLDTSGSCWGLRNRLFSAAASLPKDKFVVRLFCCDEVIEETTLTAGKIYGGGGTKFSIIESHIQSIMKKEGVEYPEAVFFITDGYGDRVMPEKPDRWYWFMTPFNTDRFIPKGSKVYQLRDFE